MPSARLCALVMLGLLLIGRGTVADAADADQKLRVGISPFARLLGLLGLIVLAGHVVWLAERSTDRQETTFSRTYVPGVFEGMYWALFNDIGPTGRSLVGSEGALPEPAQRALAGLARRPLTRRPLLAALNMLGRLTGS